MNVNALAMTIAELMTQCGEDPARRTGLHETPMRAAKAWSEWLDGYDQDAKSLLKSFEDGAEGYDEMVFQGRIPIYSHCEHHLAPIFGIAHVGYIPSTRIVGLSKLSRVCDMFAHRLQVQERITRQIADCLQEHLKPIGCGVILRCRHLCMESRGIHKAGTITYTSALRGAIKEHGNARAEFLKFAELADQGTQI